MQTSGKEKRDRRERSIGGGEERREISVFIILPFRILGKVARYLEVGGETKKTKKQENSVTVWALSIHYTELKFIGRSVAITICVLDCWRRLS